jgi:hypothetical protein
MKIHPVESVLFHVDRQTDMSMNMPKNSTHLQYSINILPRFWHRKTTDFKMLQTEVLKV